MERSVYRIIDANFNRAREAARVIEEICKWTRKVHVFDFKHVGNVFVGGLVKRLGQWNDFVQEVAAFAIVWLILYWMYRKKTFIKI